MKRVAIILLVLFGLSLQTFAGPLVGFDVFDARSFGLAQTTVADPGGAGGFQVNPAVLADSKTMAFSVFLLPWFEDMSFYSASCTMPLRVIPGRIIHAGFSYTGFGIAKFPDFDETGIRQGEIGASDHLLAVSAGMKILKMIDAGMSLKLTASSLAGIGSFTGCLDAGAIAEFYLPNPFFKKETGNLKLGLAVQNLGFPQKFKSAGSPLPLKFRAGFSYGFLEYAKSDVTFSAEMNAGLGQVLKSAIGFEINSDDFLKLRLGYRLSGQTLIGFTAGAGLAFGIKGVRFAFDYALVPLAELGIQHALSISVVLPESGDGEKK
jgi:hypothetical protein